MSAKSVGLGASLKVRITTQDPSQGTHGIYFNRGVTGQEYNTSFGEYRKWHLISKYGIPLWKNIINPRDIPDPDESKEALSWLSRGMEEALLEFISQASGSKYQIRAAVYEFTHKETIQALAAAVERGVDVKIIRHCKGAHHPKVKRNSIVKDEDGKIITEWIPDSTSDEAARAIGQVGFSSLDHAKTWHRDTFIERRHSSALMHNKFIILLEDGEPTQVWTGSANFTDGAMYGQANVAHIVRDSDVAGRYLTYWKELSADPPGHSRSCSRMDSSSDNENSRNGKDDTISDEFGLVNRDEPLILESSLESIEEEPLDTDKDEAVMVSNKIEISTEDSDKQESMASQIDKEQPDLDGPLASKSMKVIFSPRLTTDMLQFYADRMIDATTSVHLMAPFGVSQQFGQVLVRSRSSTEVSGGQDGLRRSPRIAKRNGKKDDNGQYFLRYILFDKKPSEKASGKARASAAKKDKAYVDYFDFKDIPENRVAYGAVLSEDEEWLHEDLTGLTTFVDFVHLKCLLIGKLSGV